MYLRNRRLTRPEPIVCVIMMALTLMLTPAELRPQSLDSLRLALQRLDLRISRLEVTQKDAGQRVPSKLAPIPDEETFSTLLNTIIDLNLKVDDLAQDVARIRSGGGQPAGFRLQNEFEMDDEYTLALLNKLIEQTEGAKWSRNELALHTVQSERTTGFGELFFAALRNRLEGVEFEAAYTSEVSSNLAGGLFRRTEYLDNFDLTIDMNLESLFGWRGTHFFLYILGNHGGNPSDNVGDAQGISTIDSPDTWKLYEASVQQELFDGRLSFLAGLYDLNSEFDAIETAGLFLNSSHGIGPDFSQTGPNGPSIFPTTSLGLRVKWHPSDKFYVQTVVLDGVPGDPDNPNGTKIKFRQGDGILVSTELAYLTGTEDESHPYGKIALGTYFYTTKYDAILGQDNNLQQRSKPGAYLLAERSVLREKNDRGQGLAVFGRVGFSDSEVFQFGLYTGAGAVYTGLFPGRDEDQVGVAVAAAHTGKHWRDAQRIDGIDVDRSEIALELTYRAQLTSWLAAQPDFQYVINPGTDPALSNAFVSSTRLEISF